LRSSNVPKRARPDHRQQFDQRQCHDVPRPQRPDDRHRRADARWQRAVSRRYGQADGVGDGAEALIERGELTGDEVDALLVEEGGAK
jgi:hypothetical protein